VTAAKRSPSALSTAWLREQGYVVDSVERWIPGANIRKDLYGLFDLVALHPAHVGVLGIQVTSRSNAASRRTKMQEQGHLSLWLRTGNRAHLHSWKRSGPRGQMQWDVKVEEVSP
jgi:hypothetical protein